MSKLTQREKEMGWCEEAQTYCSIAEDSYQQGKADEIKECADKFADILSDMPNLCGTLCPVKCNWGTEENCKTMCKKWLLAKLKEQDK